MKTLKNRGKLTFIINKQFNKSLRNDGNKITKYAKKHTLKNAIEPPKIIYPVKINLKISFNDVKMSIDNDADFKPKLKIFLKELLNLSKISENDIIHFLKFLNIKNPIKYALKNVPDLLALPMKISKESIPINIYKNYKKFNNILSKISLILIRYIYIKYKINILFKKLIKTTKDYEKKKNLKTFFTDIVKKINKKLSYFHLKYLVHLSKTI